jgi:hypothetical protein
MSILLRLIDAYTSNWMQEYWGENEIHAYADHEVVGMEQHDGVSQPAKKESTQMDVGRKHTDEGGRSRGLFAWPEDSRHPAVSYEYHVESLGVL